MQKKTRGSDASEFCLVLTPSGSAARRASDAVLKRFAILADETRRKLAAHVAELVQSSVEHGGRRPITVTLALGSHAIRGEIADERDLVSFEMPLTAPA
jgi:hypothetical protein